MFLKFFVFQYQYYFSDVEDNGKEYDGFDCRVNDFICIIKWIYVSRIVFCCGVYFDVLN